MPVHGLVIVNTGDGKGKTTGALGLALRAVGHGYRVRVIQFIKGGWQTGEAKAALRLAPELELIQAGRGFTEDVGRGTKATPAEHQAAAIEALRLARETLLADQHRLVILDEVLYALRQGLITLADLLDLIAIRPSATHLVLTGRAAPPEIVAVADLVTEMHEVKHPLSRGIGAQPGIEF